MAANFTGYTRVSVVFKFILYISLYSYFNYRKIHLLSTNTILVLIWVRTKWVFELISFSALSFFAMDTNTTIKEISPQLIIVLYLSPGWRNVVLIRASCLSGKFSLCEMVDKIKSNWKKGAIRPSVLFALESHNRIKY